MEPGRFRKRGGRCGIPTWDHGVPKIALPLSTTPSKAGVDGSLLMGDQMEPGRFRKLVVDAIYPLGITGPPKSRFRYRPPAQCGWSMDHCWWVTKIAPDRFRKWAVDAVYPPGIACVPKIAPPLLAARPRRVVDGPLLVGVHNSNGCFYKTRWLM